MQHQEQHDQEAARLIAEAYTDDAPAVIRYRDTTPPTPTGAAPVPQPGARAPMSQRATDIRGHETGDLAYSTVASSSCVSAC
ncbi:hypothetical protein ACFWG7_24075 [Streptomyces koyangensis]|uniref:hypothetical protein n=1 Tax=Streptomyces TaxID=1883 RepID=UPI00365F162C